jgi:hypothetical protein
VIASNLMRHSPVRRIILPGGWRRTIFLENPL